jgi:hypothetical protein
MALTAAWESLSSPWSFRGPDAAPIGRFSVLNRFDPHSPSAGEAEVRYQHGDFRVMRPGAFVRCAVTGTPIPLEELKYWSVDRQEPYATPAAALQRVQPRRAD